MEIVVCSRAEVDYILFSTKGKKALISVVDTGFEKNWPSITEVDTCVSMLGMRFPDTDESPISSSQARVILTFVESVKNEIDYLIINCMAGISRSAGVASALSLIYFGNDISYISNRATDPNRAVFQALMREANL